MAPSGTKPAGGANSDEIATDPLRIDETTPGTAGARPKVTGSVMDIKIENLHLNKYRIHGDNRIID